MTVHTISLEQQGRGDERLAICVTEKRRYVQHNRCQHEARGRSGIIRQCRNRSITMIDGQRLCYRHANPEGR